MKTIDLYLNYWESYNIKRSYLEHHCVSQGVKVLGFYYDLAD